MYKLVEGKNGKRYMKDNKFVSVNSIPISELEKLFGKVEPKRTTGKECIFCGQQSRFTRFVNVQVVYLCDQDYYDQTVGKIAQRMRETGRL